MDTRTGGHVLSPSKSVKRANGVQGYVAESGWSRSSVFNVCLNQLPLPLPLRECIDFLSIGCLLEVLSLVKAWACEWCALCFGEGEYVRGHPSAYSWHCCFQLRIHRSWLHVGAWDDSAFGICWDGYDKGLTNALRSSRITICPFSPNPNLTPAEVSNPLQPPINHQPSLCLYNDNNLNNNHD